MIGGMQAHGAQDGHARLIENVEKRVREESFAEIAALKDRVLELELALCYLQPVLSIELQNRINRLVKRQSTGSDLFNPQQELLKD